ncbi:MAG: hydrolase [candidate division Zixibacteria bacterium]|nr:hydrolase [candidate division Zixibacteria bacterium]
MLKIENTVLVVVDIQGKLATLMHEKEKFFENAAKMIKGCLALNIPVLWNEQLPDKLGETVEDIKTVLTGKNPLIKKTFSCCGNELFVSELKKLGRKQVLVIGMETHICVYQSVMDLLADGHDVHVVGDAVSSRSLENKMIGTRAMREAGARVTNVEMALFEMLRVAEGDAFKQIIRIVK